MCGTALVPSVLLSPPAAACSEWKDLIWKWKDGQQEEGAVNKKGWWVWSRVCVCVCVRAHSCMPECPVVHLWEEEWGSICIDRRRAEALCWLPYAPLRVNKKTTRTRAHTHTHTHTHTNTHTHTHTLTHAAPLWSGDTDRFAVSVHRGPRPGQTLQGCEGL